MLKPGVKFSELFDTVHSSLPDHLKSKMSESVGHSIGIEVKESMSLRAKSNNVVFPGMVLHLRIAITDVDYCILLGDTVIVKSDVDERSGNYGRSVTKFKYDWSNVAYDMNDGSSSSGDDEKEEEEDLKGLSKEDAEALREAKKITGGRTSSRLRSRTSNRNVEESNVQAELRRAEKQRELMMKRMKALQNKDVTDKYDDSVDEKHKKYVENVAYESASKYPRDLKNVSVYVDEDKEVVFLPINSVPVPFHISTIKSISKSEGDRAVFLRINFHTPAKTAQAKTRNAAAIENQVAAKYPEVVFIKDISIRSTNPTHLNKQVRLMKEMQKRLRQKTREKKEMENVVKQAPLKLVRNPPKLQDLSMKPHLSGRSTHGTLEAHENGFRFRSVRGEKLDVNYNNIRHSVFQPCKKELTVILHFNLKNPILINKKKHSNVQFYTEVVEKSLALKKSKRSMYDPDEIDEEQRERKLKRKLNDLFKKFQLRVNAMLERIGKETIEFDVPYRNLAFQGTPHKEMVTMMPCTHCLVNLTDYPHFVLSLDDIDHVHFERASVSVRGAHSEIARNNIALE